jgi:hypothetical protein
VGVGVGSGGVGWGRAGWGFGGRVDYLEGGQLNVSRSPGEREKERGGGQLQRQQVAWRASRKRRIDGREVMEGRKAIEATE